MCSAPRATALVRLVMPFQKDELKELLIAGVAGWACAAAAAPVNDSVCDSDFVAAGDLAEGAWAIMGFEELEAGVVDPFLPCFFVCLAAFCSDCTATFVDAASFASSAISIGLFTTSFLRTERQVKDANCLLV